jgi:hypothetical protein
MPCTAGSTFFLSFTFHALRSPACWVSLDAAAIFCSTNSSIHTGIRPHLPASIGLNHAYRQTMPVACYLPSHPCPRRGRRLASRSREGRERMRQASQGPGEQRIRRRKANLETTPYCGTSLQFACRASLLSAVLSTRNVPTRLRTHGPSQKLTVAARVMAPRKRVGQRS